MSLEGDSAKVGSHTPLLYCVQCTADRAQCTNMIERYSLCAVNRCRADRSYLLRMMNTLWTTGALKVWLWLVDTLTSTLTTLYDNSQRVKFAHSRCHSLKHSTPLVWACGSRPSASCGWWRWRRRRSAPTWSWPSCGVETSGGARCRTNMTHRPRFRCVKSADHPY